MAQNIYHIFPFQTFLEVRYFPVFLLTGFSGCGSFGFLLTRESDGNVTTGDDGCQLWQISLSSGAFFPGKHC